MALPQESVSMALFCDFENVALGVRDANYERFDIKPVLERLLLKGSIVVKKAYCDWERYKGFKAAMHEASFELIEIPHVRQSGKNSADIRLVVDALDLCYTKLHVDTFVIISGDSDFSPLVSKLRENAKKVIGVGVKNSTSDLLVANCDEFIFYDDLVREQQRAVAKANAAKRASEDDRQPRQEAESRKAKALAIAVETYDALVSERGESGKLWASVLKSAIKRRKPDFNESYYGFRAFGNLLDEAQARGLLEVGRDEKSGAYVYRNGTEPARAEAGAQSPAPEAATSGRNQDDRARRRDRGGERVDARKAPRAERNRNAAATEPQAEPRQPHAHALPTVREAEAADETDERAGETETFVTGAESASQPSADAHSRDDTREIGTQRPDFAADADRLSVGPLDRLDPLQRPDSANGKAEALATDPAAATGAARSNAPQARGGRGKRSRERKADTANMPGDDLFAADTAAENAFTADQSDGVATVTASTSEPNQPNQPTGPTEPTEPSETRHSAPSDWADAVATAHDAKRKPAGRRNRAQAKSPVDDAAREPAGVETAAAVAATRAVPQETPAEGAAPALDKQEANASTTATRARRPARSRARKPAETGN